MGLSSSHSSAHSYALILGEKNGRRRLPIIIGAFEAQAIAIEVEGIRPNRPMTHDLFRNFAIEFNIRIIEVMITELREGIFFAYILCECNNVRKKIDARPSDAIAIAVRFNAPIYTNEKVLQEGGIVLKDSFYTSAQEESPPEQKQSRELTIAERIERLKAQMNEALQNEDYELAARLRDEIKRLESLT
ncbi:MAG: bifunctional nuclease family protein [Bacteroidia bacterium]|nr:bifunctional nuclease family protein [Bacteroidia bacterium]